MDSRRLLSTNNRRKPVSLFLIKEASQIRDFEMKNEWNSEIQVSFPNEIDVQVTYRHAIIKKVRKDFQKFISELDSFNFQARLLSNPEYNILGRKEEMISKMSKKFKVNSAQCIN